VVPPFCGGGAALASPEGNGGSAFMMLIAGIDAAEG
jgi:hypothetical protein